MQSLIKAILIRNLDEGNLPLVFVKKSGENKYTAECELTEMGKEIIHTTTALAAANRNDDNIVTAEGHINRVTDYETIGGNCAKVVNFSDRVAMDEIALRARKFVVQSKIDLSYEKEHVVSPLVYKENLELLGDKSKAKKKISLVKVDKTENVLADLPFIYKDANNFYQFGESKDGSVTKELVWLRKVSFKFEGIDNFLTTTPNWSDEEEYIIWAGKDVTTNKQ